MLCYKEVEITKLDSILWTLFKKCVFFPSSVFSFEDACNLFSIQNYLMTEQEHPYYGQHLTKKADNSRHIIIFFL
jgi:hypothetical protein